MEALERGLEEIAGCHKTIVLLHYAPVQDTLVGEPETIWPFSARVGWPRRSGRTGRIVVHGHAHHGASSGAIGEVLVHNVAVQVTGEDFAFFEP